MGIPAIAAGALIGGFMSSGGNDEAPEINVTPYTPNQAATRDEFKPINAMQWVDAISGEEFSFVRDRNGSLNVQTRDISGRPAIDSPISVSDINVDLPPVGALPEFTQRHAVAVANLTAQLRQLQNTIQVMETTAPELIPQNAPIINAFKTASQRAMDKGFDIRRNGIDLKLRKLGLANSSTALGAEIALARDRTDAEINNALQVAQLGHSTRQQSIANSFQLGQQIVNEGTIELNRYNSESHNELNARQQDLGRESLVQNRAADQVRFNLGREQMRISTELANRQLRASVMQARNPTNAAVSMITNTNNTALSAINSDNQAMHNRNLAEIGLGQAQTNRFEVNQRQQSNPLLELGMQAGGAYLGSLAGSYGTTQGLQLGGVNPNNVLSRR